MSCAEEQLSYKKGEEPLHWDGGVVETLPEPNMPLEVQAEKLEKPLLPVVTEA
jgi:hypothetical protein